MFRFYREAPFLGPARIPERNSSGKHIPAMLAKIMLIELEIRARYSPPKKPKRAGVKISVGSKLFPRALLDLKERIEVPGDGFGESIEGHVCQAGEEGGGLDDEGRLIAPAPMGNRGEIGRVGFDEEPVQGNPGRDPAKVLGLGER